MKKKRLKENSDKSLFHLTGRIANNMKDRMYHDTLDAFERRSLDRNEQSQNWKRVQRLKDKYSSFGLKGEK